MNHIDVDEVQKRLAVLRRNMEHILNYPDERLNNFAIKIVQSVIRHVNEIEGVLKSPATSKRPKS